MKNWKAALQDKRCKRGAICIVVVTIILSLLSWVFAPTFTTTSDVNNPDQETRGSRPEKVLVFLGLYDNVEVLLEKYNVKMDLYPLFGGPTRFDQATYDKLSSLDYLKSYDTIFLNCGLTDDKKTLTTESGEVVPEYFHDPAVQKAFRDYVRDGGKLYATDWSLTTAARIFDGEYFITDHLLDENQRLDTSEQIVTITLKDDELKKKIGKETLEVFEHIGGIHLVTDVVSEDVNVLAEGSIQTSNGRDDYPVLMQFDYGEGEVVLANLHIEGEELPEKKKLKEAYDKKMRESGGTGDLSSELSRLYDDFYLEKHSEDLELFELWKGTESYAKEYLVDPNDITKSVLEKEKTFITSLVSSELKDKLYPEGSIATDIRAQFSPQDNSYYDIESIARVKYDITNYKDFEKNKNKIKKDLEDEVKTRAQSSLDLFNDLVYINDTVNTLTPDQQQLLYSELTKQNLAYSEQYDQVRQVIESVLAGELTQSSPIIGDTAIYQNVFLQFGYRIDDERRFLKMVVKLYPSIASSLDLPEELTNVPSEADEKLYEDNLEELLNFALSEELDLQQGSSTKMHWYILLVGLIILIAYVSLSSKKQNQSAEEIE